MPDFLLLHDGKLREYLFFFGWSLVLLWETALPVKALIDSLALRWFRNILLSLSGIFLIRMLFPLSAMVLAITAEQRNWGLLNLAAPAIWLQILTGILLLDFAAYLLHVILHRVPILWRVHAVHHSDKDFDCTTGLRFHPFEAILSVSIRLVVIVVFGIPILAVVIYELWAILASFYTHANARIFPLAERYIRTMFVTPGMHRIHHSAIGKEGMTNFGVIFSIWDRLLHTYLARSTASQTDMPVGLPWFNRQPSFGIARLLVLPLMSGPFKDDAELREDQPI